MDDRNLELEAWLIETTGEEMMANHLGPNWNKFNEEFGFYPNMAMTVADLVWQHQQAKVEELTYKAQLRESDHQALLVKYQATKKCWEDISKEKAELQKRVEILEATLESERWDREAGFKVFFKARDTQGQWHGFESKPEFYEVGEYWWKGGRSIYLYGDEYCDRDTAKKSLTAVKEQALKGEGQ